MSSLVATCSEKVTASIERACERAGRRRDEIRLVAVSKKQPIERINEYIENISGLPILGENYVQEFDEKRPLLSKPVEAHLIGPLQSNKVKKAIRLFDVIESVQSPKILRKISGELKSGASDIRTKGLFLQVNVSEDPQKSGFSQGQLFELLASGEADELPLLGLMTITEWYENTEEVRPDFRAMKQLAGAVQERFPNLFRGGKVRISMGMSADYEIAIEEGADYIRVGTALFGDRPS
ncbi:MAG: YggS family pyridoxal phosphate-dependent enzyme [Bdellovibrionales bacterium]|nr:YggS family pyridoxal phosphate-dependent enzyme [Bdellovibrionales bacterium]